MIWNRKNIENLILVTVIITFSGQIYLSPTSGVFRLSLAVAALTVALIHFRKLSIMVVCSCVALTIPLFRSLVDYFSVSELTFLEIYLGYLPAMTFYISYAILFKGLHIRNKQNTPLTFIFSLWLCDSFSNIVEFAIRQIYSSTQEFSAVVLQIIVVGLIRSVLTYFLYNTTLHYIERYDRSFKENRYREMVLFISSLKSELFFLQKSITDIEDTMKQSYDLYRELDSGLLKERVLTISKNIHEIKKDYYRVANGMEKVLTEEDARISMSGREMFEIIHENYQKVAASRHLDIDFEFRCRHNFTTMDYYPLISVMNNLIINSVESLGDQGKIIVEGHLEGDHYRLSVTDNGKGISAEDLELLFIPGFSTKYDSVTGRMSTGIGLCHAKEIVEKHFGGSIHAKSSIENQQTIFSVLLPFRRIQEEL